tara:strand:+ start:16 stop:315 length:300 start_codon:yes stop_codon:yes gene_type:complete
MPLSKISANGITGSITSSQIASVSNTAITGNIISTQITSVANTQITGNLTAVKITNTGGWSITPSGTKLYFNYNGTNVASLDSIGIFIAANNVTAFGTP